MGSKQGSPEVLRNVQRKFRQGGPAEVCRENLCAPQAAYYSACADQRADGQFRRGPDIGVPQEYGRSPKQDQKHSPDQHANAEGKKGLWKSQPCGKHGHQMSFAPAENLTAAQEPVGPANE